MKRTHFCIFIVVLGLMFHTPGQSGTALAATEYSLEELYRIALDRSERIRISEEDVHISRQGQDKSLAALLPSVTAFGSYTQFDKARFSVTGALILPNRTWTWGLRVDETLSLGGREFTALEIAKEDVRRSTDDLSTVREAYLFAVASSYYDVLRARKALEIARANVERLARYREAAAVRLKVGEVTKTDLLRAEAELSGAQSELVKAENLFNLTKAALARVVGLSGSYVIRESALEGGTVADFSLEELKLRALEERTELKSQSRQKKIAEDQIRFARSAYWPTVSLTGLYTKQDADVLSVSATPESFSGILSLNFPLFEGGLRRAEVREAEARYRQADLVLEDLKKSVGIEVETAYLDFMTQKGVLKSLTDQVTFAKDNYVATSKQYEFGLANSIDVIDANTLLITAERQLSDAQYNYQLSLLKIQRATGTLLSAVMGEGATR